MIKKIDSFKNRLNIALDLREMKPIDLSNRTGISESTISQYRTGRAEPKSVRLADISSALRVDPTWLMGLDVPMDVREQMEQAQSPIDHLAILINEQIKDRALSRALRVYFTLTDEQKKVILNMIHVIGSANDSAQSSKAKSKSESSDAKSNKE